jgi:hypothetical protein
MPLCDGSPVCVLALAMTRTREYQGPGPSQNFRAWEYTVRHSARPSTGAIRDSIRLAAMEAHGYKCYSVSLCQRAVAKGSHLSADFTVTGNNNNSSSRSFIKQLRSKWPAVTFSRVFLDHLWMPASAEFLRSSYCRNNGGLFRTLVSMAQDSEGLLTADCEIVVPVVDEIIKAVACHIVQVAAAFELQWLTTAAIDTQPGTVCRHFAIEAEAQQGDADMLQFYGKVPSEQLTKLGLSGVTSLTAHEQRQLQAADVDLCVLSVSKFLLLTKKRDVQY